MGPAYVVIVACSTNVGATDAMIDHFLCLGISNTLCADEEDGTLIENGLVFLNAFKEKFELGSTAQGEANGEVSLDATHAWEVVVHS